MLWGDRPDGTRLRGLAPMRQVIPHLMPARTGATVFFELRLDLTATLPWLQMRSAAMGREVTLFHLLQYALVRVLSEHPGLHRFVAGRALYQRRKLELSYVVKKRLDEAAPMTTVKVEFHPGDSLEAVVAKAEAAVLDGRGGRLLPSEREMAAFVQLPNWLLGALVALQRQLDRWNLLPGALTAQDPLYASAFLANLGSIGLDAAYHHLYDWGTVPIFLVLGRVAPQVWASEDGSAQVRTTVVLRCSVDERIGDGMAFASGLETLRRLVEHPERHAV